jgi:serine phosphatase RsbU (regulator of sigma subunit)
LLGITFLNEIMSEMGVISPSLIVDRLRDLIIEILNQKGTYRELKDGMDIIIVALNLETLECEYAGANNSLFLIRNINDMAHLEEIKPDKMPVSINENMTSFTNHKIHLAKGDILYLRTDGYADQFGGSENKKFLVKHLKELLESISTKSLKEQKELLQSTFEDWKGVNNQIDDVTIMGIKI